MKCKKILIVSLFIAFGCNTKNSDFRTEFKSLKGNYSIPISYSTEAIIDGLGNPEVIWDFVRRHSKQNLWTYVLKSQDKIDELRNGGENSEIGVDKFMRFFDKNLAQLHILWSPKNYDGITQDFDNAVNFFKQGNLWIHGSEQSIIIDEEKSMMGKYKVISPEMYSTFIVVHRGKMRYQILFSYTTESEPDNIMQKIMQIKFKTE